MSSLEINQSPLPTLDKLGVTVAPNVDAKEVASNWFRSFVSSVEKGNVDALTALFLTESYWRDILALTWDFRTFQGAAAIKQFIKDRLESAHLSSFKLKGEYLGLHRPYPDLAWIQAFFSFETDVGVGSGIFRLVPTAYGEWKAHSMFTNLEDLKGFPEKIGHLRKAEPDHGTWLEQRRRENEFEDSEPTVIIVGGGQSGLDLAARLKSLGVSTLIVEKNERIGDNWRNRYDSLCLHDPVWYDHMPYLPFPPMWPVYTPAPKLADWLESYANSLELNVWTSATVASATQDASKKWDVVVKKADGHERVFTVNHIVIATGFGGGGVSIPTYPGMEEFTGAIIHSTQHKSANDFADKKVVIIGACTSAHDVAADLYQHGIDVTMYQRSPTYIMSTKNGLRILMEGIYSEDAPPTDVADRINASFPNLMRIGLSQRSAKKIAEADKPVLDGLRKRGFKLSMGFKDAGFLLLAWERAGGYYLDVGTSQMIVDGKIKLKNDSPIARFTRNGIKFENDTELPADAFIFATGLGDNKEGVRSICGDEVAKKCSLIWGLNREGEINGCWRDLGIPGLWCMMGNLALCRFHSKHLALQIKAQEEGVFGTRYNIQDT